MTDRISHPGDVPDAPPDYVTRRSTIARIWRVIEHVQGEEMSMYKPTHEGDGYEVNLRGRTVEVELIYPPYYPGDPKRDYDPARPYMVEVGMMNVRAADSVRISYDFDRDGWKVEQASKFSWEMGDTDCDPDWQEVAFVQAWARGPKYGNDE